MYRTPSPASSANKKRGRQTTQVVVAGEDKVELSPNSLAKCRVCHKKIEKGVKRYGIEEFSEYYNKHIYKYYHEGCLPSSKKPRLQGGRSVQDELALAHKKQIEDQVKIKSRADCRESLRQLRLGFARRIDKPAYMIFNDVTLNDLVFHMPLNKEQLLHTHGIGEKKYQSFGQPILQVIKHFHRQYHAANQERSTTTTTTTAISLSSSFSAAAAAAATATFDTNNVNDSIEVGEILSCSDIVQRKFDHAAENGYIISI